MYRLFIRHPVADFERWRSGHEDAARALHERHGVREAGVHQAVDDPNDLTIFHDFDSLEAAENFKNDPDLSTSMDKSGVTAKPVIWITEQV